MEKVQSMVFLETSDANLREYVRADIKADLISIEALINACDDLNTLRVLRELISQAEKATFESYKVHVDSLR